MGESNKLKVFRCQHCKKIRKIDSYFVIMDTNGYKAFGAILPVNCNKGDKIDINSIFDHRTMRSHLMDCPERQQDWEEVKQKYIENPDKRFQLI